MTDQKDEATDFNHNTDVISDLTKDHQVSVVLLNDKEKSVISDGLNERQKAQISSNMAQRIIKTITIYISLCSLGLCTSLFGSTLVHMEIIFETTTKIMAFIFTGHAVGYTVGACICGLLYDRTNKEFAFAVATVVQSVGVISAAFVGNLYAFACAISISGIGQGYTDAALQSYCVGLWYNHRLKEPLLQAAHAFWSLGAAIGPLIIQPFLVELPNTFTTESPASLTSVHFLSSTDEEMLDHKTSMSLSLLDVKNEGWPLNKTIEGNELSLEPVVRNLAYIENSNYSAEKTLISPSTSSYVVSGIELSRNAYLTIGILMMLPVIPFISLYAFRRTPLIIPSEKKSPEYASVNWKESAPQSDRHSTSSGSGSQRVFWILLYLLLFVFFFVYLIIESVLGRFVATFALRALQWSVPESTTLVTVFFIFHSSGRFLAIPLSAWMRPRTMAGVNILLTAVAYILLLFVKLEDKIMWVSAAIAGIGMSSTFGAMILWTSETVEISGRVSSVMMIGTAVGWVTGPSLVGILMELYDMMWMVYTLVIIVLLLIIIFIGFVFFFRWRRNALPNTA